MIPMMIETMQHIHTLLSLQHSGSYNPDIQVLLDQIADNLVELKKHEEELQERADAL